MGRRGPPKKPTKLELLQGKPGKRPLNDKEPKPADTMPTMPQWLSPAAVRVWKTMGPRLHKLGLLTEIDGPAFAMFCDAYARWVEYRGKVTEKGEVVKTAVGNVIQNPYVSLARRAYEEAYKVGKEFGFTPSSRTGLQVEQVKEDLLGEFLGRGRKRA